MRPSNGLSRCSLERHDLLPLQQLGDLAHGGVEVLDVPNLHDGPPCAPGDGVAQRLRVLDRQRERLLDEHIDTRSQRQQRVLDVQRTGRADRDGAHLPEQLLKTREGVRIELACDRLAARGVEIEHAAQLAHAPERGVGARVVRAHVAGPEDGHGKRIGAPPSGGAAPLRGHLFG